LRLGRFHIHWVDDNPINVKFHVVNFANKSAIETDEKELNRLFQKGYRVSERFVQETAVVYELWDESQ